MAVIVLASCGGGGPALTEAAVSDTRTVSPGVFDVGYERIADVYLEPIDLGALVLEGLEGLSAIDETLAVRRSGGAVWLFAGARRLGGIDEPPLDNPEGWARLTVEAITLMRRASPALQDSAAERLYTAVFDAVLDDLDGYSRYVDAARAQQERASRDGYGGIGILLGFDEEAGHGFVEEVFPGTPAARGGVEAREIFVAVDGVRAEGWDLETLAENLRGPSNSVVSVTLRRPTDGRERTLELRREHVIVNAVTARLDGDIAILRVGRFNAATADHLTAALDRALAQLGSRARGIILDLRGNPGGLLGQSVAVADLFMPRGEIISTRGRHPDSMQQYYARREDRTDGLPLVVLVDGRSASGAEVVAAALQDAGRAVVVGASSFGKGSVQTVTRLPNGGELFLTWSRIFSPAGITIHRQGVTPTLCTSRDADTVEEALALFRSGELAIPRSVIGLRRAAAEDETALRRVREFCPWRVHDEELDVEVAERLLRDAGLFDRALSLSAVPTVAQAAP
jgi:carboxyl-terminal processing protease